MPFNVFDESNLKRVVARRPVVVTISVGHKFLGYREGIYKGEDFGDPRRETHSVLVVGYGTLDGEDFWLIKNSHGA
ncbi:aleurain protease [Trifolium repens]|nr:aleurain protease [Trifolium repens]